MACLTSIRRDATRGVLLLLLLAVGAAAPSSTALAAGRRDGPAAPSPRRILVNSASAGRSTRPGVLNLAEALRAALADPADNTIELDPAVFTGRQVVLPLTSSLVADRRAGEDLIDATTLPAGVVLDLSACPGPGLILGGNAALGLAGLTLQGGADRGILMQDSARLRLEHVAVLRCGGPGVAVFGQANLTAISCRLSANKTHGIEVHDRAAATLVRCESSGNGQAGLAAFGESRISVEHGQLADNGEWNLVLTNHARARLESCLLRRGGFAGIDLSESASLDAVGTHLDQGRRFGIFATGRSAVRLERCSVRRHEGRGIELQDQAALSLQDCAIEGNRDYGLILFGQAGVQAAHSSISQNNAHGASLRGRSRGSFVECSFTGNRYSGLGCPDALEGGSVSATRCLFKANGMRPIYRGPLHIDPLVPTPLRIMGQYVECMAGPGAVIELYHDRGGEAGKYVGSLQADERGRFQVDCGDLPADTVLTASATVNGATSEFNVIGAGLSVPILNALLGRTGPLSDEGGAPDLGRRLRRWPHGTSLTFHLPEPPSAAVETYLRFIADRVADWTGGALTAAALLGPSDGPPADRVTIPIHYIAAEQPPLLGRGGVAFMKWDGDGHFLPPMRIVLAHGKEVRQTCPRVLAHEVGHVLGLCHARVGLLSRMQGSIPPPRPYLNDFSPMLTYFDVLALQILHDPRNDGPPTLRQLAENGSLASGTPLRVADAAQASDQPTFSPPAERPDSPGPTGAHK